MAAGNIAPWNSYLGSMGTDQTAVPPAGFIGPFPIFLHLIGSDESAEAPTGPPLFEGLRRNVGRMMR